MAQNRIAKQFAALLRAGMAYTGSVIEAYEHNLEEGQAPDYKVCQGLAAVMKTLAETLQMDSQGDNQGMQVVIGLPRPEEGKVRSSAQARDKGRDHP